MSDLRALLLGNTKGNAVTWIFHSCHGLPVRRPANHWLYAMVLTVLLLCTAHAGHAAGLPLANRLGTAVRHHGKTCLSISNTDVARNARLLLIGTDTPNTIIEAQVSGPDPKCAAGHNKGYALRLIRGTVEEGLVMAAAMAPRSHANIHDGTARIDMEDGLAPLAFHTCASQDGIHVTAWRNRPLDGARVWHAYVYLGVDLDADCTEKETSQQGDH